MAGKRRSWQVIEMPEAITYWSGTSLKTFYPASGAVLYGWLVTAISAGRNSRLTAGTAQGEATPATTTRPEAMSPGGSR